MSPRRTVAILALTAVACTAPNPNYDPDAAAAVCSGGTWRCSATGEVQVCSAQADGTYAWTDEFCAAGGLCEEGHCAPPEGAPPCERDGDCGAAVCVLFVVDATVARFCAPATGPQAGGAPCQTHADCRSGLCQRQSDDSTRCYRACGDAGDCGSDRTCQETAVTITGVRGTAPGCMTP